ncbi:MAG: serine/threonine-protein kinase [Planctomycetota bacterium]|nr:serine/threonine-protein kinase [Planctomycetota bacterium]
MTRDQLDIARQLLDLARGQGDPGEKGVADDLLRQLAERSFGSDQTLSPEGIQVLVGSGKEHLEGFSGSARDFLDWFESQLAGDSEPEGGGQETLQPDGADQETAVIPAPRDRLPKGPADSPAVDVDDDMQATLVAPTNKAPVPTTPVVEPEAREFGDYVLLEMIAQGGMGVVYKARQKKLNRIVAIKMIRSGQFADPSEVDRFYVEAEAAANLKHDNIVTVYEIGESDGQHFFSMDYIEGESLSEAVSDGPMLPETAASLMLTMTETIEFAHQAGILHRDLKPSNVLLDKQDKPLLTDFGLAKQVNDRSQLTMSGTVVGTPSYMPPEQAAARAEEVDVRSDVYSLGAILYELITGVAPFKAATTYDTLQQVLKSEPVNPRVLNSAVPVDLETICLKCLQKERERRYATAQDLADELQRFIEGVPIQARPVSRPEAMVRWCKRNPRIAALSGAAFTGVLVALVAMTISYFQILQAKEEAELSFRQAKKAVDEFFTEVADNRIWKRFPETESFRKQLLERTQSYYTQFMKSQQSGEDLGYERAATNQKIARCFSLLGDGRQAMPIYDQSIRQLRKLHELDPGNREVLLTLSDCLSGRAEIYNEMDGMDKAVEGFVEARELRVKYQEISGAPRPEMLRKLANAYMNEGMIRREQLRRRKGLDPEQKKNPRATIYSLFDNARSLREDALELARNGGAESTMTKDLSSDLAKGANGLYELFSGEFVEMAAKDQTLESWQRANGYLVEIVGHIRSINESSLSMEDRYQLVRAVSQQLRWMLEFPENGKEGGREEALDQVLAVFNVALDYADQLALAKDNPAYQGASLLFYLDAASSYFDQGQHVDVVACFRRLGYAWRSATGNVRQKLVDYGKDPGLLLGQYVSLFQFDAEDLIANESTQPALDFVRYCAQMLNIAEQNAWIPDGELLEYRSGLSELRQKIAQIGE